MTPVEDWDALAALFAGGGPLALAVTAVSLDQLPLRYRGLLAHRGHMTSVVQLFYQAAVDVRVLARRTDETAYSREIVLFRRDTGAVVLFALARYDLQSVTGVVRDEILGEKVPIGLVLIRHGVECEVRLGGFLRIAVGPRLASSLEADVETITYGRIATIVCDGTPAFLVAEILAPLS